MIDFFSEWYASIRNKNRLLTKLKIYSLYRFIVRRLANLLLPISLNNRKSKQITKDGCTSPQIIVSLTTFPARIEKVWMVIESMAQQSIKADQIILWLSKEQFSGLEILPKKLIAQQNRGLQIRLVDGDLRSHKKYYYSFMEYPDAIIITIDDDVFYHSKTIESLIENHKKYPESVIANNVHALSYNDKCELLSYNSWDTEIDNRANKNVQIGIGGVLYPNSNTLYKDLLKQDLFMNLAKHADDMWLFAMTRLAGNRVIKTNMTPIFLPVIARKDVKLVTMNKGQNMNDVQIQNISKYYIDKLGINPFSKDV